MLFLGSDSVFGRVLNSRAALTRRSHQTSVPRQDPPSRTKPCPHLETPVWNYGLKKIGHEMHILHRCWRLVSHPRLGHGSRDVTVGCSPFSRGAQLPETPGYLGGSEGEGYMLFSGLDR